MNLNAFVISANGSSAIAGLTYDRVDGVLYVRYKSGASKWYCVEIDAPSLLQLLPPNASLGKAIAALRKRVQFTELAGDPPAPVVVIPLANLEDALSIPLADGDRESLREQIRIALSTPGTAQVFGCL